MFKKAKSTFLSKAGRRGAPSVIKPFAQKNNKRTARAHASAMGKLTKRGKTASAKMGKVFGSSRAKKAVNNYRNGNWSFPLGAPSVNKRFSNFFSGKGPKGKFSKSVTGSPQTAPQSFKPRS